MSRDIPGQAHSSVEKAGLIGLVKMRYIESDENLSMRGDKVVEAIQNDREKGLIPFFVSNYLTYPLLYLLTFLKVKPLSWRFDDSFLNPIQFSAFHKPLSIGNDTATETSNTYTSRISHDHTDLT